MAPLLALMAVTVIADDKVDLPVATQGTEQWAGVLAKAMSAGGRNQADSLQALSSFQEKVFAKIAKTVSCSVLSAFSSVTKLIWQNLVYIWQAFLYTRPVAGRVMSFRGRDLLGD